MSPGTNRAFSHGFKLSDEEEGSTGTLANPHGGGAAVVVTRSNLAMNGPSISTLSLMGLDVGGTTLYNIPELVLPRWIGFKMSLLYKDQC